MTGSRGSSAPVGPAAPVDLPMPVAAGGVGGTRVRRNRVRLSHFEVDGQSGYDVSSASVPLSLTSPP